MTYETVLDEVLRANVEHKTVLIGEGRALLVPTLLDNKKVMFIAWIEGNRMEIYRFIKRLSNFYILIYRDYKGIWQKRSVEIDMDLYQFKGF